MGTGGVEGTRPGQWARGQSPGEEGMRGIGKALLFARAGRLADRRIRRVIASIYSPQKSSTMHGQQARGPLYWVSM
jgi:hypothetical protein